MKKKHLIVAIAAIFTLSAFTIVRSVNWQIKEGYSIKFDNPEASGVFTKLSGEMSFDSDNLNDSKFNLTVDVNSINTGNGMKNKHAKGVDWFNAEKYPNITFLSKTFQKKVDSYEVKGTLSMHGVSKEISIPFEFKNNTFSGTFSLDRSDYKVGSSEGMSKKVPSVISIEFSVPVTEKQ